MNYPNTTQLRGWLSEYPALAAMDSFELDDSEFARHLAEVKSRPEFERRDAAAFRCLPWNAPKKAVKESAPEAILLQQDQIVRNHAAQLAEARVMSKIQVDAIGLTRAQVIESADRVESKISELSKSVKSGADGVQRAFVDAQRYLEAAEGRLKSAVSLNSSSQAQDALSIRADFLKSSGRLIEVAANHHAIANSNRNHVNESLTEMGEVLKTLRADCQSISDGIIVVIEESRAHHAKKPMFPRWAVIAFCVVIFALMSKSAFGQNVNPATVVAVCGTPPGTYPTAGNPARITVDINGQTCATAAVTVTPPANQNVTIIGIASGVLPVNTAGVSGANGFAIQGMTTGVPIPTTGAYVQLTKAMTALVYTETGGTATFTPKNVATGAGRVSNQVNRGSGALPMWFKWEATIKAQASITIGLPARVYAYCSQNAAASSDYLADAAVTAEAQFSNFRLLGSIYASTNAVGPFFASGDVYLSGEYCEVGLWNATGQSFTNVDGDNKVTLTPMAGYSQGSP